MKHKKDWIVDEIVKPDDFNRIEGNIEELDQRTSEIENPEFEEGNQNGEDYEALKSGDSFFVLLKKIASWYYAIKTKFLEHKQKITEIEERHARDVEGIQIEMSNVKKSVSDGKTLVAAAITRKRVETSATATYQQMANNIDSIALGWGNAAEWQVLDSVIFSNADGVKRTGTMPNISAFDSLKSMVESQGTLYCRMSYGAHITNASSGYPELMIGMALFGSAPANRVLKNHTFTSSNGLKITGTMPDNSGVNTNGTVPGVSTGTPSDPTRQAPTTLLCPDTAGTKRFNFRIPEGYYGSNCWVNIPASNLGDAAANHVLKGKTFTSSNGVKITGTISIEKIEGVIVLSADAKNDYYFTIKDAYYQGGGSLKIPSLLDQTMATAIASHILSGKTAWIDGEKITGTMANKGNVSSSLNCGQSYTIPQGYHAGGGKVTANSLSSQTSATAVAANILSGKTAWVNGNKITGTLIKGDFPFFRFGETLFDAAYTFPADELAVGSSQLDFSGLPATITNKLKGYEGTFIIHIIGEKSGSSCLNFYTIAFGGRSEFNFMYNNLIYNCMMDISGNPSTMLLYTESTSRVSVSFSELIIQVDYGYKS